MQYLDLCIINLEPCDRGSCSVMYSCFMITCGKGMWNHHQQAWLMGTVKNISTHLPSLFRKVLREVERCLYSNFYASSERENGEIYKCFANVLPGPFRHSLYKKMTDFFHTKESSSGHKDVGFQENSPQSTEGRLVQVGLLSVGVETQLGPPGPPVPTPVKVFWLQNITWNPDRRHKSVLNGPDFYVRTPLWWNPTWGYLSFTIRGSQIAAHKLIIFCYGELVVL